MQKRSAHIPRGLRLVGEMGARIAAHDWEATPVGRMARWPSSLKTSLSLCLASRYPMFLWWGSALTNFYNDAYAPILGARHPDALGGNAAEIWHEIWPVVGPQVDTVLATGDATWNDSVPLLMERNGYLEETFFTFSYSPAIDDRGDVAGVFCACQEETGRVRSSRALAERERLFTALVKNLPDIVFRLDLELRHLYISAQVEELTGIPAQAFIGKTKREAGLSASLTDPIERASRRALKSGKNTSTAWSHNGRELRTRIVPERDDNGVVVSLLGITEDVTEFEQALAAVKRSEQTLREADRRKDEFLAMLAHELRNPLAPIRNAAEILWLMSTDPERVRETSEIIVRQARHMNAIVDDLLDVSRVTRGLITLDTEPLDLRSVITAAIEQSLPLIDNRRHSVTTNLPDQPVMAQGDRVRLTQVFCNLLNNAAKYTPQDGTIRVAIVAGAERVEVDVVDNGDGIDADLLPQVFNLFAQGQRTLDRAQGGLGIGLSLVKTLVDLHGGTIEVSSEGIGRGSRFTVGLPRLTHLQSVAASIDSPTAARATPPRALRIMVVDDNVDAAEALAMMLELDGHTLLKAHDARSAIVCARSEGPDVLLLDIGLPDIDGYELARRLRALPEVEDAMLIAVTGYGQAEDRRRAEDAGFDHYLVKPVDFESLRAMLNVDRVRS
ncbi:MAG TPA: ATP-binding protein [Burkholderiaceae bacterium]|nr:ATP-binding protein [Burkholderiaceae bacterium]